MRICHKLALVLQRDFVTIEFRRCIEAALGIQVQCSHLLTLASCRDTMLEMEFRFYDTEKQGHISGQDFASILIDAAPLDDLDDLLDKVRDCGPCTCRRSV